MKYLCTIIILTSITFGCKLKEEKTLQSTSEIAFEIKTDDKEDLEIFEDGIIPWISIENPEEHMNDLVGKDEIVIQKSRADLLIDYPLNNPVVIRVKANDSRGFTRKVLIEIISSEYHKIYKEEEETAQTKTIPSDKRVGLINRNQTDGKYGICCHDIGDLDLSAVLVRTNQDGEVRLELFVES